MKTAIYALIPLVLFGAGMARGETFTLKTEMSGELAFIGPDGTKNPTLELHEGDGVELIIENGDGVPHIFTIPELDVKSARVDTPGEKTIVKFAAKKGAFKYFCPLPGHRRLGMEGTIVCKSKRGDR